MFVKFYLGETTTELTPVQERAVDMEDYATIRRIKLEAKILHLFKFKRKQPEIDETKID